MAFDLGLVAEATADEQRTLLRPSDVVPLSLVGAICAESGLGAGVGFSDDEYSAAGACVVSAPEAWRARLVAKFRPPTAEQISLLGDRSTVAAVMHAEGTRDLVESLIRLRARAIAFEYLTIDGVTHPLMSATGEISGYQAVTYAAYYLQRPQVGYGRLLAAVLPHPGALVTVIGFGHVGRSAARAAAALGARVRVVHWGARAECTCGYECTVVGDRAIGQIVAESDVIIGALRISTFDTPAIVTESAVRSMRPGSVIVDVTAGYGAGYIETSTELTTLKSPVRLVHGVTHIKLRNFPRATPHESVARVSTIFAPVIGQLLAVPEPQWVRSGLITEHGRVVHAEVRRHFPDLARP